MPINTTLPIKEVTYQGSSIPIHHPSVEPKLQSKEVTPTKAEQNVSADATYDGLSSVKVNPIPNEYIIPNGSQTLTENKDYDVASLAFVTVDVPIPTPSYDTPSITVSAGGLITASANGKSNTEQLSTQAAKTVDPTESVQTVVPSGKYTTGDVKVNAISSTYVGSGVAKKSSTDLTVDGATVTAPAGYYATSASKAVATGTAGTPSATKGTITNHSVSITPSVTNTTGYITGGTKTGTAVTVSASELVSGSETKTSNGTYDVTNLAELVVNVSGGGGSLPSGISAFDFGDVNVTSAFTTSRKTFSHNLGVVPDLVIVFATANVAQTYSMLFAIRGNAVNWRGGNYSGHMAYHGNSTSTVTWTNANSTSYGISNMTATTFQLASSSSSYYWRAGTYKYIAIKFS